MEGAKEFEYWRDAIVEELPPKEVETFQKSAQQADRSLPNVSARLVVWQFEGRPYGLTYLRTVQKDQELMTLCKEVIALYRREIEGEGIPQQMFQDLHVKITKAWDIVGWRERERRMAFARKWAWFGARKWAWLGMRAWSNTWSWAITATRNRNYAQAVALIRLWAEVRVLAKKEIGKKKRIRAIEKYFLHLIQSS